jgi:hypothetical protein
LGASEKSKSISSNGEGLVYSNGIHLFLHQPMIFSYQGSFDGDDHATRTCIAKDDWSDRTPPWTIHHLSYKLTFLHRNCLYFQLHKRKMSIHPKAIILRSTNPPTKITSQQLIIWTFRALTIWYLLIRFLVSIHIYFPAFQVPQISSIW